MDRSKAGGGRLRWFPLLLGGAMIVIGVGLLADRYAADYSCSNELRCQNAGSRTPSATDRAAAALGFGVEHPLASVESLPGPEGTILVAGGLAVWFVGLLLRPRQGDVELDAGRSGIHPLTPEEQLAQYERLRERGTLSDAEFEVRRDRLLKLRPPSAERPT